MEQKYDREQKYDLIVIGAGPGGYEAALHAASLGMKTAVVEKSHLGGACLNRGCIPTKSLLHSAGIYKEASEGSLFGVEASQVSFSMEKIHGRKDQVVQKMREGIAFLLKSAKVDLLEGRGIILDRGAVQVMGLDGQTQVLRGERILIATGAKPAKPPVSGMELPEVLTSDEMLEGPVFFQRLLIVGGGVIGMEFASLYSALGCQVTVVEAEKRILPQMDREIAQNLSMILKKRGVRFFTGSTVNSISKEPDGGLICRFEEKGQLKEEECDGALISIGRKPEAEDLFSQSLLDELGGEPGILFGERGHLKVDENFQTALEGVWAIGDVTGGIQLAHAATAEGIAAVDRMAGRPISIRLDVIPSCVYTEPEIATVGVSSDEAKAAGIEVKTHKYSMLANGKSVITEQERGFIKVIAHQETGVVLGAQLMCARATDLISELAAAVVNELTVDQLRSVVRPHPTFCEGISEALKK